MAAPEVTAVADIVEPDMMAEPTLLEGIDAHAQEVLPEAGQGYDYTRADGTVEHAATAEEAMRRCPVLGKMSLEQANVLLEIAAIGKEKLEKEASQQNEPQNRQEDTSVQKSTPKDAPEHAQATARKQPEHTSAAHTRVEVTVTHKVQDKIAEFQADHRYNIGTDMAAQEDPQKAFSRAAEQEAVPRAEQASSPQIAAQAALQQVETREQIAHVAHVSAEAQTIAALTAEPMPIPPRQTSVNMNTITPVQQTVHPTETQLRLHEMARVALPEIDEVRDPESIMAFVQGEELEAPVVNGYHAGTENLFLSDTGEEIVEHTEVVYGDIEDMRVLPAAHTEIESKVPSKQPEPEVVFENFTKALDVLLESSIVNVFTDGDERNEQGAVQADVEEVMPAVSPAIRHIVEKINEVEEKSVIVPVVAEIAALTVELQSLDGQDAETVATVEDKLEVLCITLFEQLNIEYDEEDIRLLVQVITNSKFVVLRTEISTPDLEREGMREAKRSLTTLSGKVADEKRHLKQMLGRFTLLYSQFKAIPFTKTPMASVIKNLHLTLTTV